MARALEDRPSVGKPPPVDTQECLDADHLWYAGAVSQGIPDDVRQLLEHSIGSVRQLDLLLLMRESGREREWTVGELTSVLRSSETAVEGDLAGLLRTPLVEVVEGPPTRWRYRPGSLDGTVDTLSRCYRTHRTSVIGIVAASPRNSSLGEFAEAFRFRRRGDQDG